MNKIISLIKKNIEIIKEPKKEFSKLSKITFESVIGNFFIMLLCTAVVAGIVAFIVYIARAIYLDMALSADIDYIRMINYSFGRVVSIVFFYIFAGVFILAMVSWLLKIFVKIRYTELLKIIFYSLSPILLFSWIPLSPYPLFIWTIVLFSIGVSTHKTGKKVKKSSIEQRD
jgi:hypothetical protein